MVLPPPLLPLLLLSQDLKRAVSSGTNTSKKIEGNLKTQNQNRDGEARARAKYQAELTQAAWSCRKWEDGTRQPPSTPAPSL